MKRWYYAVSIGATFIAAACSDRTPTSPVAVPPPAAGLGVAGAGYTTGINDPNNPGYAIGCLDNKQGVDCNNYATKGDVYMNGGPPTGSLTLGDGSYYFAVLTPGSQNGGFLDGATGNLSDETVGGTAGDLGSGDLIANRTFTIATVNGVKTVIYNGTHATGVNPQGNNVVQLMPYDDTDNHGGVYILAICASGATSPSQCKYDAFRIRRSTPTGGAASVAGAKYYDANRNGRWDAGESFIPGWNITMTFNGGNTTLTTIGDGTFSFSTSTDFGTYAFAEQHSSGGWVQTGNTPTPANDQTLSSGGNSASLLADMTYSVTLVSGGSTDGVFFGNVCAPTPGGLTIGFWSNKNGAKQITAAELNALSTTYYLVSGNGARFTTSSISAFQTWLLQATASNMANMLSAQYAGTYLNLNASPPITQNVLIDNAPAIGGGFSTPRNVATELLYASWLVQTYPNTVGSSAARTEQERVKNLFDSINNGLALTQTTLSDGLALCGTPQF